MSDRGWFGRKSESVEVDQMTQDAFLALMQKFVDGVVACDGTKVAECFTPNGVYRDIFYGDSQGHKAIANLIENSFHRDAGNFKWELHEPVCQNGIGYVRFICSYESKFPEVAGKRAVFEGVSVLKLENGLLSEYHEVVNHATGLAKMGFEAERIRQILLHESDKLAERPEVAGHL